MWSAILDCAAGLVEVPSQQEVVGGAAFTIPRRSPLFQPSQIGPALPLLRDQVAQSRPSRDEMFVREKVGRLSVFILRRD
jgi:hypothetical protein